MRASSILLLIAVVAACGGPDVVLAQGAEFGQAEYVRSCAACHGPTGKGNGPVAGTLNIPPTDLTKLSESNNGVFPVAGLYEVIDGKAAVVAHGTREMPVWGGAYEHQLKGVPGNTFSRDTIDALVRVRILALIEYISTLQGK
jgi:mono/diheme cytochrome c family protein